MPGLRRRTVSLDRLPPYAPERDASEPRVRAVEHCGLPKCRAAAAFARVETKVLGQH